MLSRTDFGQYAYPKENKTYSDLESERKSRVEKRKENLYIDTFFCGITGSLFLVPFSTNSSINTYYSAGIVLLTSIAITYLSYKANRRIKEIDNEYGEKMKSVTEDMDSADEFYYQRYDSNNITEPSNKYPGIGLKTVIAPIKDIYIPENSTELVLEIDIPVQDNKWTYDYPFTWDTEEKEDGSYPFAYFAEEQGYNKKNYMDMIGHPIAIKIKDGNWNTLLVNNVEELIKTRLENNDITINDIDVDLIEEMYDIELPECVPTGEEIIMDNNPLENDTGKDWR